MGSTSRHDSSRFPRCLTCDPCFLLDPSDRFPAPWLQGTTVAAGSTYLQAALNGTCVRCRTAQRIVVPESIMLFTGETKEPAAPRPPTNTAPAASLVTGKRKLEAEPPSASKRTKKPSAAEVSISRPTSTIASLVVSGANAPPPMLQVRTLLQAARGRDGRVNLPESKVLRVIGGCCLRCDERW